MVSSHRVARRHLGLAGMAALLVALVAFAPASVADPPGTNPWLARRVLGIAHAGGENESPHSTIFAFDRAIAHGVNMIDLDLQITADGVPVIMHNATVDRTTNGTGAVDEMTFAQVHALDAAYWFTADCWSCTGRPLDDYLYRGMRTGANTALPPGAAPDDFGVPSLRQVFERYPDMYINMELKTDGAETSELTTKVAALIKEFGREDRTIVASFDQGTIDHFRALAPTVTTSATLPEVANFFLNGVAPSIPLILDVPPTFTVGSTTYEVLTPEFVTKAHEHNLAVWVWPNSRSLENTEGYAWMLDMGVDGINAAAPGVLMALLNERGVAWVDTDEQPVSTSTTVPATDAPPTSVAATSTTTAPSRPAAPPAIPVAGSPTYAG